ncbi:MAG: DUF4832 domain-containing protein [Lentisphaerae bacterium]|jgi:hypothetical protein|nr:DUF4832 domain-containing protein [Lentisphaerota bacterium]MBT4817145.1 DUF4832 domain-containing protein [Lentisphaerota bacterium]MBT5611633.1 DUF4832 domain-containing protein [Lentisphaerota bacterium]MBT7056596.1 DUF4832 domain-containing protein [Lentisphaerota bacterium]MBT7845852.1 DUF4832 domain-containing protein [Lentisphaerota bacterium]
MQRIQTWLPATAFLVSVALQAAPSLSVVTPVDNGAELTNPGMGWVLHYYDNVPRNYGSRLPPADLLPNWPGLSMIYLRIPWAFIEPEEGVFNWSVVDTPMQRFSARGLKASFRFTCSESWMEYPTPEWVRKAGAKGYRFRPGKGTIEDGPFWEPDFDDPIFMKKLDRFLAAASARYDGHPDVAYIDVGSFGVWGEGHTWSSTRRAYPNTTIKAHVALHRRHFHTTQLVAIDDFLSRPGTKPTWHTTDETRAFDLHIPREWWNRRFFLRAGVWQPGQRKHKGRLLPYQGQDDRTVRLGELTVDAQGIPLFTPEMRPLPPLADLGSAGFAVTCAGFAYAAEIQPHSAKTSLTYRQKTILPANSGPFLHVVDSKTGKEICSLREEREDDGLTRFLVEAGCGLRDDSILVQQGASAYFHAGMAQHFWPTRVVTLESEHYGNSAAHGRWGDGSGFLHAVRDYHASYASIHWWPHEFLDRNRDLVRRINLCIGYRFQLTELAWADRIRVNDRLFMRWTWRNAGVAPPYRDAFPCLTLKDDDGGIVAVIVDHELNLRTLPVSLREPAAERGNTRHAPLPFQLGSGAFDVFVSVGDQLGKPEIALPLDGDDGQRRYRVGTLMVSGDFAAVADSANVAEGKLQLDIRWNLHQPLSETARPFIHIEEPNGKLLKAGGDPGSRTAAPFRTPRMIQLHHVLELPQEGTEQQLQVKAGIWQPNRIGNPDERYIPDHDQGDRRQLLGKLRRTSAGWQWTPAASPDNEQ